MANTVPNKELAINSHAMTDVKTTPASSDTYGPPLAPPGDGELLRTVRKRLGLSQADLAKVAGLSRSYVPNLETGHSKQPRPEHAAKMAVALHCESWEQVLRIGRALKNLPTEPAHPLLAADIDDAQRKLASLTHRIELAEARLHQLEILTRLLARAESAALAYPAPTAEHAEALTR